MEKITFREYRASDHDQVWAAFAACTYQLGFALGPWDDDMHNISSVYVETGGEFLVGESQGQIVAFGGLTRHTPERGEIRRVGVHPDWQGRGFARLLIAELEALAQAAGIIELFVDTSVSQTAAQALYRNCGYREAGHIDKNGYDCILFEKRIA